LKIIVKRAEQIQINKNHELWSYCNGICFASKNLYNYANYITRFLEYLKGIETLEGLILNILLTMFLEYITGIEINCSNICCILSFVVFRAPYRD
jgi:hypothetical protein